MVTVIVGNNCPAIRTIALLKWLQCDRIWCDGIHICIIKHLVMESAKQWIQHSVLHGRWEKRAQEHDHISCDTNIVEQRIWFEQFSLLFEWPQKVLLFFTQEIVDRKSERWSFLCTIWNSGIQIPQESIMNRIEKFLHSRQRHIQMLDQTNLLALALYHLRTKRCR